MSIETITNINEISITIESETIADDEGDVSSESLTGQQQQDGASENESNKNEDQSTTDTSVANGRKRKLQESSCRKAKKHACNFSLCDCHLGICKMRFSRHDSKASKDKEQLTRHKLYNEFMLKCDPEYKDRKYITLCDCHMDKGTNCPRIDPIMVKMCQVIKNEKEGKDKLRAALKTCFTDAQLYFFERLSTTRQQFVHWSPDTMCRAVEMLEKLGEKAYLHLLSTGYPLPSIRSVQRFNESVRKGVDSNIVEKIKRLEGDIDYDDQLSNSCDGAVDENNVATHDSVHEVSLISDDGELIASATFSSPQLV